MEESVEDGWYCSTLNRIASVLMSPWMFDEEESQEKFGEAARVSVEKEIRPARTSAGVTTSLVSRKCG